MSSTNSIRAHESKHVPTAYEGKLEPNYYCRGWNEKRQKYCKIRAGAGTDHKGSGRCKSHGGNSVVTSGRYSGIARPSIKEKLEQFEADADPLNLLPEVQLLRALILDFVNRYDESTDALVAWRNSFGTSYQAAVKLWRDEYSDWREKVTDIYEGGWRDVEADDLPAPPEPPDPFEHENKPRQVLDILSAGKFVGEVGKMVERIEKQRQEGTIRLETLDRVLEQLGVEVVKAVQQHVPDADTRTALLRDIEKQWGTIRLEPTTARPGAPQGARELN
ncbi:MAG: hypothetical protein AVDCRST_MAG86-1957 [uncultured Truepera sp.]|uniref:Uncharacterized protein n=1 Tax=uncultured Truepera sp. TaxID=543023 RepID=A0A6J4VB14_9DEIN|nr:MAG: hypothetical protein AVDCRST_MAG86-1957 [uncultured Truepera sp.]